MYSLYDRILGSLVTAGMGDGVGAPSEGLSYSEIVQRFNGPIDRFCDPKDSIISGINKIAEITDDASQMWEMAQAIIATNGELTEKAAADALLNWSKNWPRYYPSQAGPTMRNWILEYEKGEDPIKLGMTGNTYSRGMTNGCAMRVAPAALVNPGDLEGAIKTTVIMTRVSHGTQHAFSGACAVSCAIAEALTENSSVHSVLKAAIYGAKKGEEIGLKDARKGYGPRVLPTLLRAINCVYAADNPEEATRKLDEEIGCSIDVQPTVSSAIALFAANDGDPIRTIVSAANIGGDTDTIACIAGMISGAFRGFSAIPEEWYMTFRQGNPNIDFETVAEKITKIALERSNKYN